MVYASVDKSHAKDIAPARLRIVNDANRWNKLGIALLALRVFWVVFSERPDIVISTGAAPGFFGVYFGKLLGDRPIDHHVFEVGVPS